MPMVPAMLEAESGVTVDRSLSPDEAVAHGAAIYAGLIGSRGETAVPRMTVTNVNAHDLGVLAIEPQTGRPQRQLMIARNTPLPATGIATFVTCKDGQRSVRVTVLEGGDRAGRHATRIGKCVVPDLPESLPARTPVEVRFHYAANGRLEVQASLPDVGRHAAVSIQRASGLTDERLKQWQKRLDEGQWLEDLPEHELDSASPPEPAALASASEQPAAEAGAAESCVSGTEPERESLESSAEFVSIRVTGREAAAKTVDNSDPSLQNFLEGLRDR
jgi:molecular chaperone DnaK